SGLPLRLTPELDIASKRSTVTETYGRIILDLEKAVDLLPTTSLVPSRPNKVAALAMLARVYLSMGVYEKAGEFADKSLQLTSHLIEYNTISQSSTSPIPRFNGE